MLYALGRVMGRAFAGAPLISSVCVIALLVYVERSCSSHQRDIDAATKVVAEMEAAERARMQAEAAAIEAAKTPEQRASEARAAKLEAAAAEARRTKEEETQARFEKAVDKVDAQVSGLSWDRRCARWGQEARKAADGPAAEALRRNLERETLINSADQRFIRERIPQVGMTACGAIAILGRPEATNATTRADSTRVQWVYRDRGVYVYTSSRPGDYNGIIESVQH